MEITDDLPHLEYTDSEQKPLITTEEERSGEIITTTSETLLRLETQPPSTICAKCPAAIWQMPKNGTLKVYCRLLHQFIEEELEMCDGVMVAETMLQQ